MTVDDFMGVAGLGFLLVLVPLLVIDAVMRWVFVARSAADDTSEVDPL